MTDIPRPISGDNEKIPPALVRALDISNRLEEEILRPMKQSFVHKDDVIELLGVGLVSGENVFLLGPPGTAKSAIVQELSYRLEGLYFDYLLTRFTEPNELFGPFDIRKLREGELVTNTQGMLPEASLVFLDELLNANSAILNSLLMVLNERVFRRGSEYRKLPLQMVVGASNHLPEDEALQALFDRFSLRIVCGSVPDKELEGLMELGWQLDARGTPPRSGLRMEDVKFVTTQIHQVDLSKVREPYMTLVLRLRKMGVQLSDRRVVRMQRIVAASALLAGRLQADTSDLWVLRHVWEREEQIESVEQLVQEQLQNANSHRPHPQAAAAIQEVNAEALYRDLEALELSWDANAPELMRERLQVLQSRAEWIHHEEQRSYVLLKATQLWQRFAEKDEQE
jgi:MoxR-like ATPase